MTEEQLQEQRASFVYGNAPEGSGITKASALRAADEAWENGHLDFTNMEDYLATQVQAQLDDDGI